MGELLGALGLAWPRLLLYPGGLFALSAGWLLSRWLGWCAGRPVVPAGSLAYIDIIDLAPLLAALALLPLAPAQSFPYGIDLVVAVGLLEWPRLRAMLAPGNGSALAPGIGRDELARSYGPLLLAALGIAEGAGGLGLSGLLAWPGAWPDQTLLMACAGMWLIALARLLDGPPGGVVGQLRAVGLLLVGALPLVGALAAWVGEALPGALAGWLIPPVAALGAALVLGGLVRLVRPRPRSYSHRGPSA